MTEPAVSRDAPAAGAAAAPAGAEVSPWRLPGTLGSAGAAAGLLIVLVFGWTQPTIQANKARVLEAAIHEVLKAPDRYDTLYVLDGALAKTVPAGRDPRGLERVYLGYRAQGERIGFAIAAGEPGFQDVIRLIFGYDPTTRQVLGMKVLESKETPGLGDKIEKAPFVSQFDGAIPPLVGVKRRDPGRRSEIDTVTGATISSRTVVRAINEALDRLGPLLEAYQEGQP
jgi:electron transport complex protein RnfG